MAEAGARLDAVTDTDLPFTRHYGGAIDSNLFESDTAHEQR
jgi:hypothetical protein